jgi:fatty-acyl-CoA synthase
MLSGELMQAAQDKGVVFDSVRIAGTTGELSRRIMPNALYSFTVFGLTETYAPIALSRHDPADMSPPGAHLLPGNECRIVDPETGLDQPPGVPGEALLRGNVARGYWNKPVETAKAFRADGWFHSEDLCTLDEQGRIKWVGRLKLMLKVGGENVSLEEVERIVSSHEALKSCAATGIADTRKGEAICLYVQCLEGSTIGEQELRDWLKPRLAHFKLPREIVFLDAMPQLGSGKVDRVTLGKWAQEAFPG